MKIGIDTSALMGKATGTARYISCLLEQATLSGNEIISFKPGLNPSPHSISFLPQILSAVNHGGIKKHLYRNFILKQEMINADVDCALFPDYFMPPGFTKPSAVVIHDLSFISHPQFYSKAFIKFYAHQMKNTLRQNPLIITISKYSRKQIEKHLSIPKEKIFLLQAYSGIREISYPRDNSNPERPYFLFVGHVEPRKNLNFLAENFIKWNKERKAGFKLKIVGEIWIKSPEIKLMLSNYRNHPDIEFTGYVQEDELDQLYRNASAFVHTSFMEGFGMPVLEAMHYGLPILCTADSATEEISSPYSVTIDPYSSSSMIIGFDNIFERILKNPRENYNIKYTPEKMREQINNIWENLENKIRRIYYPMVKKSYGPEEAVEKTLLYAKLFNTGIKKENLHSHLFDLKLSRSKLEETLIKLQERKKISFNEGILYLNNHLDSSYKSSGGHSPGKEKAKKLLRMIGIIPFISLISFSGGTAHYGFDNHNDIDLFIITKPNTAYLSYFIIHFLSLLFRVRKELCANYLIDENNLEIKDAKDFYTAHQIITLVPFNNAAFLHYFWKKNEWVKEFFPNFLIPPVSEYKGGRAYRMLKPFNKALKKFYRRLYKKMLIKSKGSGSLTLSDNCIKLHTNDYRFKITSDFAEAWDEYMAVKNRTIRTALNKPSRPQLIETLVRNKELK